MPNLEEMLKIKNKLKSTEIVKTLPSGEVRTERRTEDGEYIEINNDYEDSLSEKTLPPISNRRRKKVEYLKRCGFVVDLEPDLIVAQPIKNLFFGSQDVAADIEILNKHNITHILNVGTGIPNHFPNSFTYLKIDILDLPETQIINYFDHIFPWIDEARNLDGKVFVHCNAGISRSPTIILGYVMKSQKIPLSKAMEMCRKERNIRPNSGFARQLADYQHSLCL